MKQYEVKYVELSDGEKIAYRQCGSGKQNLVLIHGNMSSSVHMQPLMEKLEPYFTIYAPDMRGFGDSSYCKPFDSLEEVGNEIEEFLEIKSVHDPILLGWSTAGGVIMEMAAKQNADIKSIILLSSVGIKGYPLLRKGPDFQPIEGDYLLERDEIAADPIQVKPALDAYAQNDPEYFRTIWNLVIYTNGQPAEEDYKLYLDAILKERCLVDVDYSLVHFNISDEDTPVQKASGHGRLIKCPITIIHGEADMVVPVENAREAKNFFGDQAELHILKGLSHSIITDDVDALAEIIKTAK
jgi:Predicted hydrolases or acyltransferases (alpha/beta hydrolase superfamily)